jgi:hypothetical protein
MPWLMLLLSPSPALAYVPYGALERLRRLSVVTRVVADAPAASPIPSCPPRDKTMLGQKLELAFANRKPGWKRITIEQADLETLGARIARCADRGSCQVYEEFLGTARSAEAAANKVAALLAGLETRLSNLEPSSYAKALKTVPNACARLRELEQE